jgi:hypothetical protein
VENKISGFLNMVSNVIAFLNREKSQWDSISILDETLKRIAEEHLYAQDRFKAFDVSVTNAVPREKALLFDNLTAHSFKLALKLSSHAQLKKDDELLSRVNYSIDTLKAGSEYQVLERCYTIAFEARARLQYLSAAGALKKEIESVEAGIEKIKKIPPQLFDENISEHPDRSDLVLAITRLRRSLDSLDDMIDCMMRNPEFRQQYHELRERSHSTDDSYRKPSEGFIN